MALADAMDRDRSTRRRGPTAARRGLECYVDAYQGVPAVEAARA